MIYELTYKRYINSAVYFTLHLSWLMYSQLAATVHCL